MAYIIAEVLPDAALLAGFSLGSAPPPANRRPRALVLVNPAGSREELADLYLDEGEIQAGATARRQVIQAQPDELDPYYRRGLAALAMSDTAAALPDPEKGRRRGPEVISTVRDGPARAGSQLQPEQPERADQLFQAAIAFSTLSSVLLRVVSGESAPGRAR